VHQYFKLSSLFFYIPLFLIISCEKESNGIIDSQGSIPFITVTSYPQSQINTDTINIGSTRKPEDILSIQSFISSKVTFSNINGLVSAVNYSVINSQTLSIVSEGALFDDGNNADQIAGDSIYSGYLKFQIQRVEVGYYTIKIFCESTFGLRSNTLFLPLFICRSNNKPIVSNLRCDSIVALGNEVQILQLRIMAQDTDGQQDIYKVFFNSFKPGGAPSSGNPFQMYDDANANSKSGDIIAGDGDYGLMIQLPPTTTPGIYQFHFQAIDRSLDSSNVVIKNITITQ
jgi:hypothetical protein